VPVERVILAHELQQKTRVGVGGNTERGFHAI
jgi:hypothetical protein